MTYKITNVRVIDEPTPRRDGKLLLAHFDTEIGPVQITKVQLVSDPDKRLRVFAPGCRPNDSKGGYWVSYAALADLKRQVVPIVFAMTGDERLTSEEISE